MRGPRARALALLFSLQALLIPSAVGGAAEALPEAASYADYFGVDIQTAEAEMAAATRAGQLEEQLLKTHPEEFAGLWIQHDPTFAVIVALTTDRSAAVALMADEHAIGELVSTRVHQHSLADLNATAARFDLPAADPFNLMIDIKTNEVVIEVLERSRDRAAVEANRVANVGDIVPRITTAPALGGPTADIYGGLSITGCTAGFSVTQGSTHGLMTAGHCPNGQSYASTNLPLVDAEVTDKYDAQWHTTPNFTDRNKIKIASNGTTRTITGWVSYNATPVGAWLCKYGYTTFNTCGEIESKTIAPSYITSADPVFISVRNCGVDMVTGGDSGGPVYSGNSGYGIVSGWMWGGVGCWTDKLIFNHLTHALGRLAVALKTS